jgi:predicted ATP-grasp superfamily ATP-dependent carboligase
MSETGINKFLVIGLDVVSLASSIKKAGYNAYAIDFFGDLDLKRICNRNLSIIKQMPGQTCGNLANDFDPKVLIKLTKELINKEKIDGVLLSSGLDDSDILFELNDLIPIIGNNPQTINNVRNKSDFFKQLSRLKIPHPEIASAENFEEAKKASKDIGFPVVIKPLTGCGGAEIKKATNPEELKAAFHTVRKSHQRMVIQEHISGIPASLSLISSARATATLTLNEQLMGMSELGQKEPFGYCGNLVPLSVETQIYINCRKIAEEIASLFNLKGSNGIDLVISKDGTPYIIEVNPRFQGTLECIERVLQINIVEAHLKACLQGTLPSIKRKSRSFCIRLVIFARQHSVVPNFTCFDEVRDVPLPKVIIEEGEPICSIIIEGKNRFSSINRARIKAEQLYNLLQIVKN